MEWFQVEASRTSGFNSTDFTVQIARDIGSINVPHPSNSFASVSNSSSPTAFTSVTRVTSPSAFSWYWITVALKSYNTRFVLCTDCPVLL